MQVVISDLNTQIHFDVTMYVQKKYFVEKKVEIVVSFRKQDS